MHGPTEGSEPASLTESASAQSSAAASVAVLATGLQSAVASLSGSSTPSERRALLEGAKAKPESGEIRSSNPLAAAGRLRSGPAASQPAPSDDKGVEPTLPSGGAPGGGRRSRRGTASRRSMIDAKIEQLRNSSKTIKSTAGEDKPVSGTIAGVLRELSKKTKQKVRQRKMRKSAA